MHRVSARSASDSGRMNAVETNCEPLVRSLTGVLNDDLEIQGFSEGPEVFPKQPVT